MNSFLNGFNRIAGKYDALKEIIFGKAIYESQVCFLRSIAPGGSVLILGGGSGEILPLLREINPGCRIWFVEASSEMLEIAEKRLPDQPGNRITFIHGTETGLPHQVLFDAVVTGFFLDLFPDHKLQKICDMISMRLTPEGLWLVSDCVDGKKLWQKCLLWLMYRFFTIACGVEARKLPQWNDRLQLAGMEEVSSRLFYRGFIKSAVFRNRSASSGRT